MTVKRATDECSMIAEYIKALGDQDLNNLEMLLNDVFMGGCIPKWVGSKKIVEKLPTRGNYKCSVQIVYDGVKREMCGREWHDRRYTRGFQN